MKITIPSVPIALTILFFGLLPKAQAVSPAPDGGYPGGNTAEGQSALFSRTTGGFNTAVGLLSLRSLTTGSFNTGVGAGTLLANTADNNTATGAGALLSNTTGSQDTATGAFALFSNTTGGANNAFGDSALFSNTTGGLNGYGALYSNTTSDGNTATGALALYSNSGIQNTANGYGALASNSTGGENTADGYAALINNTTGTENTANGVFALNHNTDGSGNTAIGWDALLNNTTGFENTALGEAAGSAVITAGHVLCLDHSGGDVSNTTWIGHVYNTTTQSGTTLPVVISDQGQLGSPSSSRRFKKNIQPMDKASESILALKPVTFHYKTDTRNIAQFGLVAEEVAEVNPDLVVRDENGEIYTVRYDAVNAMLLNEFLKDHTKIEEQQATIAELKSTVAQQRKNFEATIAQQQKGMEAVTARLNEQAAQIQKVSAQIEVSKFATGRILRGGPAPQVVNNP